MYLGEGIFGFSPCFTHSTFLHTFFAHFHRIHSFSTSISPHHGDPEKAGVMQPVGPIVGLQPSGAIEETGPIIVNPWYVATLGPKRVVPI